MNTLNSLNKLEELLFIMLEGVNVGVNVPKEK